MAPTLAKQDEWTLADIQALDEPDWWRYEIVDGALLVSPSPGLDHERVSALVRAALSDAAPAGVLTVGPVGVQLARSYRIPDLVVVAQSRMRGAGPLDPADLLLAVEVVSPGSVSNDRLVKPAQYASAGITHFWRIETDPVSLTAYALDGETYREVGVWGAGQVARIGEPFDIAIELDRLV